MRTSVARRSWKVLLVLLCLTGTAGACLFGLFHRVAGRIDAHRTEVAALLQDIPVRSSTRPALLEPAEPGNAWDLLRPAMDEVGDLYPLEDPATYGEESDQDLGWRGILAETFPLIERATPALEQCRRAMHRTDLDWTGPVDPSLPVKAGRIGRALCTKAIQAWQQGRDAEGAEWLVVAMGVAQDTARLGQRHCWTTLRVVEQWACREARLVMGRQDLTSQELGLLSRRLKLLRSTRPPFSLPLREEGAFARRNILDGEIYQPEVEGESTPYLPMKAGWRDLYSAQLLRLRLLNGIREGVEELSALEPTRRPSLPERAARIRSRYSRREVAPMLPIFFDVEDLILQHLEQFRLAVEVARAMREPGAFPRQLSVDGVVVDLGTEADGGILRGKVQSRDLELVWTVGRRTKD